MRVLAALVLAPLAIAVAYAGGWLWALLVTLVSIGLFAEWLMVVGAGGPRADRGRDDRHRHDGRPASPSARSKTASSPAFGGAIVTLIARGKFVWAATGFAYAAAALLASILVRRIRQRLRRADVRAARGVGDRYRRLFRRPRHWRTETVAARQPEEDLVRGARRLCGEPFGCGRLCGVRDRKGGSTAARQRHPVGGIAGWAICSNPR